MIIIYILLLIIFSFLLLKSADLTVVGLRKISKKTGVKPFFLSAILLALGTSFPELFVGITSAIEQSPNLALGVVIGSNIANISLVVGLAGLSVGTIHIKGGYLKRDLWIALLSGLTPIILVSDGALTRPDGVILIAIYVAYATSFFKKRYLHVAKGFRFFRKINHTSKGTKRGFEKLALGIGLLLLSADMIVRISKEIAISFDVPLFIVGLIILAIGTSLPELAFSFRSLKNHESGMFFGNLLGSVIANSTIVIGITSVIHPITVTSTRGHVIAGVAFILVSLMFWNFARTKHRIDRWEAGILLLIYIAFVLIEFLYIPIEGVAM